LRLVLEIFLAGKTGCTISSSVSDSDSALPNAPLRLVLQFSCRQNKETMRDVLHYLKELSETDRNAIGERIRSRVLQTHTSDHRAAELESYARELLQ
jgi:hypothetical protein